MDIEEKARLRDEEDRRRRGIVVTAHQAGVRIILDSSDKTVEMTNLLTVQVATWLFYLALGHHDSNQLLPTASAAIEAVLEVFNAECANDPKPVRNGIQAEIARHFLASALSSVSAALSCYDAEHPPEAA